MSFFLLPSSDHPHRQTGSDWASGMPRISNSPPWEPTWRNLVKAERLWRHDPQSFHIKSILKWAAPQHSQLEELDFTKHMFLLSSPARHWPTSLPHLTQSHLSLLGEAETGSRPICLQSDSVQMDLFARSVTSSQSVHRSNKCLPAKTLTIASKQRVSQTWCDSGTKWVPTL